jgi:hypothetical protein
MKNAETEQILGLTKAEIPCSACFGPGRDDENGRMVELNEPTNGHMKNSETE